jgi:hypothetical protein
MQANCWLRFDAANPEAEEKDASSVKEIKI